MQKDVEDELPEPSDDDGDIPKIPTALKKIKTRNQN